MKGGVRGGARPDLNTFTIFTTASITKLQTTVLTDRRVRWIDR